MEISSKDEAFFRDWSDAQLKAGLCRSAASFSLNTRQCFIVGLGALQDYIGDSGGHSHNPFTSRQQLIEEAARITREAQQVRRTATRSLGPVPLICGCSATLGAESARVAGLTTQAEWQRPCLYAEQHCTGCTSGGRDCSGPSGTIGSSTLSSATPTQAEWTTASASPFPAHWQKAGTPVWLQLHVRHWRT